MLRGRVVLRSSQLLSGQLVIQEPTELKLGRCPPLNIPDSRCGRSQLELSVRAQSTLPSISVTRDGVNPSFIQKKGSEEWEELERYQPHPVHDGDSISVFLRDYPVTFHVEGSPKRLREADKSDVVSQPSFKQSRIHSPDPGNKTTASEGSTSPYTLAFLSVSTAQYHFDVRVASQVVYEEVHRFLTAHDDPALRLILVDRAETRDLAVYRQVFREKGFTDSRFQIMAGDITSLRTTKGIKADCIINAANSTLSDKGQGANRAIHDAAGPELYRTSRQLHPSRAQVGQVYPVTLSDGNPFFQRERVRHIIQICGPNMNPQRANYLKGDYQVGRRLLSQSYQAIFACYYNKYLQSRGLETSATAPIAPAKEVAATVSQPAPATTPFRGRWQDGLEEYLLNPSHPSVCFHDDRICILRDKFPKADNHILVITQQRIKGFSTLDLSSIALLQYMAQEGRRVATEMDKEAGKARRYNVGFHAVPSMTHLHLHIISDDFQSEPMKNKKHWNSFTNEFFIFVDDFIEQLEKTNAVQFDRAHYENLLKQPLTCFHCQSTLANFPKLKLHIPSCHQAPSKTTFRTKRAN